MTEQELISKLQGLKQIKPNTQWVSLAKTEIFKNNFASYSNPQKAVFTNIFSAIFQRKMAYSLAVLLFVFVGISGVWQYTSLVGDNNQESKPTQESPIALAEVKNSVESFKVKSQNLADMVTNKEDASLILSEVKNTAKELTMAIKKDPQLAKKVALDINNNKTLLDISGANSVSEVSNMYETIVVSLMKDLEERSLTADQSTELERIKTYINDRQDYITALRDILMISQVSENK